MVNHVEYEEESKEVCHSRFRIDKERINGSEMSTVLVVQLA